MRLEVTAEGAGEQLLDEVAQRAEDVRPALWAIAEEFRQREARAFATGGFGAWAALDPATKAAKGSGRILVDSGGLLASLTRPGDRYHLERITADTLEVGTRHPAAHLQRDGARGMPRRNPVPPPTAGEREQWSEDLLGFLLEGRA